MKKVLLLLLTLIILIPAASCSQAEKADVNVTVLAGPTGMGAAKLMNDNAEGKAANNYSFTVSTAPDEVTAAVISGSTDIAAVPTNLASVLYNKTGGEVQVLAINTAGVLYMLENGDSIQSVADLRGKTIYASGQSATPEYVLDYILSKNGIDPETDVDITYVAEHSELASLMSSGDVSLGMLPEPNVTAVTSANSGVRVALNMTEEWSKVCEDGSALVMGCVIARKEFIDAHPDAVKSFLKEYKASIEYVNSNNAEAAQMIADQGIVAKAEVALKALPNCNIVYVDGSELKTQLSGFLGVLYSANPASVGGAIPDDAFYYAG